MGEAVFCGISFIKPGIPFERAFTGRNHAPMFRRRFHVPRLGKAMLYVCGLGYGYFYLNGCPVSPDLFTAPVSDYRKTLWYNVYEVSGLLRKGENVLAAWCGNGWYNEEFRTSWDYDKAPWRDHPKFILRLDVDGETVAVSDNGWKCCPDSAVYFNALRSGEYFDARKYRPDWNGPDFDDGDWQQALTDDTPPGGVFRECRCEPIREIEVCPPRQVTKTGRDKFLYDLGRNISGYVRLTAAGHPGQMLTIRYGEQVRADLSLETNQMTIHYPESEFQTDRFICSGEEVTWSPRFAYHGFRYMEIEGADLPGEIRVLGVSVHQAVEARSGFRCSDEFLNRLFAAGQHSTCANLFYMPTDCPTREKLGWANDAAASAEQFLTNFKTERLLKKWLQDIYDAMDEKGALPGIIPTSGWGFDWGNGPVSDGVLFEIPYRIYLHTGNTKQLVDSLPYFQRYLAYVKTREDEGGWVHFGLDDWARPGQWSGEKESRTQVPACLINALLIRDFYRIAALAASLAEESGRAREPGGFGRCPRPGDNGSGKRAHWADIREAYQREAERLKQQILSAFLTEDKRCTIHRQTAVAMLIYYGVYEELDPLKNQLRELVEEADFHHDCGMAGLRRLYEALDKCGLSEYAYRILTAGGYPGYGEWLDQGADTLWETWDWRDHRDSKNHHMYSHFMAWMIHRILGIRQAEGSSGFGQILAEPYFFKELEFAQGYCDTCAGRVEVSWRREGDRVRLEVLKPGECRSIIIEPK